MTNSNDSWPKLLQRTLPNDGSTAQGTAAQSLGVQAAPSLPRRPSRQLYQPHQWVESSVSMTSLSAGLSDLPMDSRQQKRQSACQLPAESHGTRSISPSIDDRPPTTDRIAAFVLDIPDGVRNMTQHPNSFMVGSVAITVTKPTKAHRIKLSFVGQQRVYLRDGRSQAPLPSSANFDYTMFEKHLALWGADIEDDSSAGNETHTLMPGTLRVPFSIKLPRVNYPSTIKRDKTCRVRYLIWATLERPGTFKDHTLSTHKEEIYFEPWAYPTRPREVMRISNTVYGTPDTPTAHLAVEVTGGTLLLPAEAGDRIMYKLDARTKLDEKAATDGQPLLDVDSYVVRFMRLHIVEKLKVRGLIKGREQTQIYRNSIHSVTLVPNKSTPGMVSNSKSTFSSNGYIRLPLDMCPFDSKHLKRTYELRVECDVVDKSSLLDKMMRHKSTYSMQVPLEICTISPDKFDKATYQNAYTDETRNISSITPLPHHKDPAEPWIFADGWELEKSFVKWDRFNPVWIELARKHST
ncbi:hypothetical protein LPJ79_005501 [Coemansia sp. RSA 1821]|nr:hypothetical protein BX667DRAFT_499335 [Coemansia mojavensis]KAJ1747088.1 hypothetical protein LPJ79_005501 [Coemansia sp. RSA 1821]KAJ2667734.1 hypothetical protein IWW42_005728 [Coemansia sp. RSA 1085]